MQVGKDGGAIGKGGEPVLLHKAWKHQAEIQLRSLLALRAMFSQIRMPSKKKSPEYRLEQTSPATSCYIHLHQEEKMESVM